MTEQLVLTRIDERFTQVQMTTELPDNGLLTISLAVPTTAQLKHMPLLELQADLMEKALAHLQHKLQAARAVDRTPPTPA